MSTNKLNLVPNHKYWYCSKLKNWYISRPYGPVLTCNFRMIAEPRIYSEEAAEKRMSLGWRACLASSSDRAIAKIMEQGENDRVESTLLLNSLLLTCFPLMSNSVWGVEGKEKTHVKKSKNSNLYSYSEFQHLCKSTQLGHKPHCSIIKGSVFTSTCSTETVSLHNYNCGIGICRVDVQRCGKSLYAQLVHIQMLASRSQAKPSHTQHLRLSFYRIPTLEGWLMTLHVHVYYRPCTKVRQPTKILAGSLHTAHIQQWDHYVHTLPISTAQAVRTVLIRGELGGSWSLCRHTLEV